MLLNDASQTGVLHSAQSTMCPQGKYIVWRWGVGERGGAGEGREEERSLFTCKHYYCSKYVIPYVRTGLYVAQLNAVQPESLRLIQHLHAGKLLKRNI